MLDIPRITIGILVAVCPLFAIAETPQATDAESAATETQSAATAVTPAATSPVFTAPSAKELAKITHAKIRLEILQMAVVDQLARSGPN